MMHQSLATIDHPQFINLQPIDINPLMSKCEIKVFYTGVNRNGSSISKDVATEMAKTLRGAPIVGYFRPDTADFGDHGERVTIENGEIKFDCMTKPYGFVAPDAQVWFQKFEEKDEQGQPIVREYLMTTGFLWTGQYEECKDILNGGRPHSMELDSKTLSGSWSEDIKNGAQFFIINDAIFSKLCILGSDVEPCFEGSSIKTPEVSKHFVLDSTFTTTLYSMIQDLKQVIEGGFNMDNENKQPIAAELDSPDPEFEKKEEQKEEDKKKKQEEAADYKCGSDDDDKKKYEKKDEEEEDKKQDSESDKPSENEKSSDDKAEKEQDDKKKKFELIENENSELKAACSDWESKYNALQSQYNTLNEKYSALVEFKNGVEEAKKDQLINSFYMLSDEDKKEIIDNKANYTYDEIEAKLCVLCVRNKVSFEKEEKKEEPRLLFQLGEDEDDSIPPYIKALMNTQKNRK